MEFSITITLTQDELDALKSVYSIDDPKSYYENSIRLQIASAIKQTVINEAKSIVDEYKTASDEDKEKIKEILLKKPTLSIDPSSISVNETFLK